MEERRFINKAYLKSLLPVSLAVLLIQLCSVVNNLIVGKIIGSDGLAIMSVVSPVGFVFATIGSLLGVGGSIQSAHALGENNVDAGNRSLYIALKIMAVCGTLLTVGILLFTKPLMALLGVPDALKAETERYLRCFAPAAFAAMGVYIPFNFFKIRGAQQYGVYVSAVMLFVNAGLDFLLGYVLKMGMAGIGLATTLGYWSATLPGIIILYSRIGGFAGPRIKKEKGFLKKIIVSGSPSAVNNLCHLLRSFFMNLIVVAALGQTGLSTLSIISTVFLFSVAVTNGTSLSMAPFAAVFYSERDNISIRQVFAVSVVSAIVLMAAFVGLVEYFPDTICRLFSVTEPALVEVCAEALRFYAVSLMVSAVNTIFSTFYQSIKHTLLANILTVFRSFAFVVLFALILSKISEPRFLWLGFLFAEILTLLLTFGMALIYSRLHRNLSKFLLIDTTAEKSGRYFALSVDKDNNHAAEYAEKVTAFCEQNELSPKLTMTIGLAIEEILVSFNEHALKDEKDSARTNIRILIHGDIVVLRFRTGGRQFDPIKYAEENDDLMSDSMGIKMVQKLSEVVMYDRVFGLNNLTILF